MAAPSILPLFAPQVGVQREFQGSETQISTVNVPCTGLSNTSLANWLQAEHRNQLELLQAAWSISLRSYTGSNDVLFSCLDSKERCYCHVSPSESVRSLFNIRRVELHEGNSTAGLGANSVVYVDEENKDKSDSTRLDDLREFDLAVYFSQGTETNCPVVGIHHKPSVISTELATMIAATVAKAIEEVVCHVDCLIEALDICSDADINCISHWNRTSDDGIPFAQCIHHIISQKCATQQESIAVSAWDGELTYAELDSLSSALAIRLQHLGVRPEVFVPLIFDKSKWAVIALLGVLKAGGAYFFLNPSNPIQYNLGLCSSLSPGIALCSPRHSTLAKSLAGKVAPVGGEPCGLLESLPVNKKNPLCTAETGPSNAMYITFTSGTTGMSKGITTEHSAFYSMAMANGKALQVSPTTRMLQFASYTFDVSNRDMLITLMFGGCICIPSELDRLNDLSGFINRHSVNLASLTPSLASTLTPALCPSIQGLVLGGEPMNDSHISAWAKHVRLFNAYGVSESAGIAALASDIQAGCSPGNIGFGSGSTLWVVASDQPDKLAPIGALGELVIEGPSVARGYLGDKTRTEKQFTTTPKWKNRIREQFGESYPSKRAFHTGDLVRYNLDGSLNFVGRKDHQVKINGQRLELTAIERHIAACVEVAKSGFLHIAVVTVKNEANGSIKLLAFLGVDTSRGSDTPSQLVSKKLNDVEALKAALKRYLLHCLPTFMVPVDFVFLQNMPLTTSGKINRLLLQEAAAHALLDDQKRNIDAPDSNGNQMATTPQQRVLIQSWAKALGIEDASITCDDCFFRRGGDSIAAIKMAGSLRQQGFIISVSDIFNFSTLSDMASVLVEDHKPLSEAAPASFSLIGNSQTLLDAIVEELGTGIGQIEDVYPCTHMQRGLIALTAQHPHAYIGSYIWQLAEMLDVEKFKDAWKGAWLHNPILRTRIVQIPDGVFQVVMKTDMPWKTVTDITGRGDGKELRAIDINHGPLIQFYFSKEAFRLDIHHSLFDEWSLGLIMGQVERAYLGGELHTQPFSPFVHHLLHERDTTVEDFWRREFSGLQAEHFPAVTSRPLNIGHSTEKVVLEHDLQLGTGFSTKYTLSSIVRLAWAIVLWRQTGSEDVVFGATVSGRNANIVGIDQLSGPTLATLPVRIKLPTIQTVHEGLSQVQGQFVNMMVHEQTGLSRIRQVGREAAEACNFQNLLVVQPYEQQTKSLVFKTSANSTSSENAKSFASYPMVLICRPEKSGISMKAAFDPAILAPAAGHSILKQMSHVIQQLVTSDSTRIADVSLVPPEDMAMLRQWNHLLPNAVNTCIHDRIQELCIAQPDALAIHSKNLDLTYGQLDNYSNQFAQRLISIGVKKGAFVPLFLERSPWVPVIMLAVLKTGAAFVLLDLSHPIQRLRTMCSMIDARIVVTFKEHTDMSGNLLLPVIVFDPEAHVQNLGKQATASELKPLTEVAAPDAPACVVFSSGSTGLPKGIVLPHIALTTSAAVMRNYGMLGPSSRVFHFASFAFDISIGEILFTLAAGACVCVPHEEERKGNPAKSADDLQVTWALLTPSVINLFEPSDVPTLEVLGTAGEPLTPHIVDTWAHRVKLFGMYAPAECTVISHIGRILPDTHHSNIGLSHGGVSWVADPSDHNRLVPIGTVGELIVEGPTVSSGYLNDPEKTNEVFITSPPWLDEVRSHSGRMYKTGDLVRQTTDGSLEFVGRKDDQVKLHGQRVEVGEVEHCINSSCTAIRTAAVECIKIREQNNRVSLVAFISPQADEDWGQSLNDQSSEVGRFESISFPSDQFYSTIESMETSLRELLPAYMVPSFFVPLADVPLSLSGKVNRRLLRDQFNSWPLKTLELYQLRRRVVPIEEVPLTVHGREVQEIVGQALNLDPKSIPMNSNFFALGGDSISAMQVSMLARRRGMRLTVADIFTQQTLSRVALKCTTDNGDTSLVSKSRSLCRELSGSTMKPSHRCEVARNKLPGHLPQEIVDNIVEALPATEFQTMTLHNFYSRYLWISLPDEVNQEHLLNACDQLVQKHSVLRTVFYTSDDKSVVQLTLRKIPISFVHYSNIENLERHCADDSLAMGVPIDGVPGFQVQLVTLRDSGMYLILRLPHALFDGVSLDVICNDLSAAYSGNLLPPCAQFSDHIRHVWDKRTPETYNVWRGVLGEAPMTSLNNKYLRNWGSAGEMGNPNMGTNLEEPTVVTAIAETLPISPPPNITLATLVKLAWAITLSLLFTSTEEEDGGSNDVVFGQVIHGRGLGISHEDRIVGPCLNIIPVRVRLPPRSNKLDLLGQVQKQHIQTMSVENLELGEIAQNCTSWKAGTRFGSFIRFQNFANNDSTCSFDGSARETGLYSLPNRPSNTANVLVVPHGPTLTITMTISNQVLDRGSADYVAGYFSDVIGSLANEETVCEYLV